VAARIKTERTERGGTPALTAFTTSTF